GSARNVAPERVASGGGRLVPRQPHGGGLLRIAQARVGIAERLQKESDGAVRRGGRAVQVAEACPRRVVVRPEPGAIAERIAREAPGLEVFEIAQLRKGAAQRPARLEGAPQGGEQD